MKYWTVIVCFLYFAFAKAQGGTKQFDFSMLRQNDNIRLDKEQQNTLYKKIKSFDLGKEVILSFGGSYRFQTELFINEQFSSEEDQNDVWFLHRFQVHSHLKLSDRFEVFVELNSSLIDSKEELSPVDKDELSMNQFFVKYNFNNRWNALVGRQNLRLGTGRLVDIREGPNVRLSFDMAQLNYADQKTSFMGLFAVPVRPEKGIFDNDALNFEETLAAAYWTQHWTKQTNTDIYILYKEEASKIWNNGAGNDERVSFGLRHFGLWKGITYNNEFVYQTGSFEDQNISAWTASFNVEYLTTLFSQKGVLGLKTEAISGDKRTTDNTMNTFDGLYPRSAYFGRVARFGPSNLIDIHPYINMEVGRFFIELDYVAFWRFSRQDGIYGPALNLEYSATQGGKFIGHQFGTLTGLSFNDFINLELETNVIVPRAFLTSTGLDDTVFHTVLTAEIKF